MERGRGDEGREGGRKVDWRQQVGGKEGESGLVSGVSGGWAWHRRVAQTLGERQEEEHTGRWTHSKHTTKNTDLRYID